MLNKVSFSLLSAMVLVAVTGSAAPRTCREVLGESKPPTASSRSKTEKSLPVSTLPENWKPYRVSDDYWRILESEHKLKEEIKKLKGRLEKGEKKKTSGYLSVLLDISNSIDEEKEEISEEKKAAIKREIAKLEARLKSVRSDKEAKQKFEMKRLIASLKTLSTHAEAKELLDDVSATIALFRLHSSGVVSLAIGSQAEEPTAEQRKDVETFVKNLKDRGYLIVFDGESKLAPAIEAAAGDRGIALLARRSESKNTKGHRAVVTNDYLRMAILKNARHTVVSLDSLAGMALLLTGNPLETTVWNNGRSLDTSLNDWTDKLNESKRNLGVAPVTTMSDSSLSAILDSRWEKKKESGPNFPRVKEKLKFDNDTSLDSFSFDRLQLVSSFIESSLRARIRNANSGGAVIFGSSTFDPESVQFTYDTAYMLGSMGVPVVTGGAGGTMFVANKGAFDAGGMSIGVPITNKTLVTNEDETSSDVQTSTIDTPSYEVRIPTLLLGRPLVIFAPGGRGTIQELAVVLMEAQRAELAGRQQPHIVFLDPSYYGPMADWLKAQKLPASLENHIHMLSNVDEVRTLAEKLQADGRRVVTQAQPKKPRSPHKPFEIPKFEDDFDWGGL